MSVFKADFRISYIPGDDSGPEVIDAALKVMDKAASRFDGLNLEFVRVDVGYECYLQKKETIKYLDKELGGISEESINAIKATDALLYSAVAGERLLKVGLRNPYPYLKKSLNCFADVRHGKSYPNTGALRDDLNIVLVRETSEGFGQSPEVKLNNDLACQVVTMSRQAAESLARTAFQIARYQTKKPRKVTCIHKAGMSPLVFGLFRDSCRKIAKEFPDIEFDEMHTDYLAYALIKDPSGINVVVTDNFTGEIISGEIPAVIGGLGIFPGAVYGEDFALFKPSHGTAPDIAGQDIINPCATILSGKMMLEWLGDRYKNNDCLAAAQLIDQAVWEQFSEGKILTKDMGGNASTSDFTKALVNRI